MILQGLIQLATSSNGMTVASAANAVRLFASIRAAARIRQSLQPPAAAAARADHVRS